MQAIPATRRSLSMFSLVMINVVAVDSLRSLPIAATYGFSIVFFYALAALTFFIPSALVTAELATGWPNRGGIYVWVREAFGWRAGLIVIWLQWIYNVIWYPTIISFIVATAVFLFNPALASNKLFMLISTLSLFWIITLMSLFGMRVARWICAAGAIVGTLLPMVCIAGLGLYWISSGHASHITMDWQHLLPQHGFTDQAGFFLAILFGLLGLEMSAVHADEVHDPQRSYPRALYFSVFLILFSLVSASLAIAIVLPHANIDIVSGLINAFNYFFTALHLPWALPLIVFGIVLGAFANVSSWIIGPAKGMAVAMQDLRVPRCLQHVNKHRVPTTVLLLQGVLFSVLCMAFIVMPSVSSSYWLLSAMCAQLALVVYIMLFAAALRLRYKNPHIHRAYRIPGGKIGIWLVVGVGCITCVFAIGVGFLPPADLGITSVATYHALLLGGIALFVVCPLLLSYVIEKK